jgi:hypothetical protein
MGGDGTGWPQVFISGVFGIIGAFFSVLAVFVPLVEQSRHFGACYGFAPYFLWCFRGFMA